MCSPRGRFGISRNRNTDDSAEPNADAKPSSMEDKKKSRGKADSNCGKNSNRETDKGSQKGDQGTEPNPGDSKEKGNKHEAKDGRGYNVEEKKDGKLEKADKADKHDKEKVKEKSIFFFNLSLHAPHLHGGSSSSRNPATDIVNLTSSIQMVLNQVQKDVEVQEKYKLPVEDIVLLGMLLLFLELTPQNCHYYPSTAK